MKNVEVKFPLTEDISMKVAVVKPVDWNPGYDVTVPPAGFCDVTQDRVISTDKLECKDWFYC